MKAYEPRITVSYTKGMPMNYRVGDHIVNPSAIVDITTGKFPDGRPVKQSKLESAPSN